MKKIKLTALLIVLTFALVACATSNNKKCNGKRGIMTPMGIM